MKKWTDIGRKPKRNSFLKNARRWQNKNRIHSGHAVRCAFILFRHQFLSAVVHRTEQPTDFPAVNHTDDSILHHCHDEHQRVGKQNETAWILTPIGHYAENRLSVDYPIQSCRCFLQAFCFLPHLAIARNASKAQVNALKKASYDTWQSII